MSMKWIKLTHWKDNVELWVDFNEVVHIERKNPIKSPSGIVLPGDEDIPTTQLAMKNGRVVSCTETPDQIFGIVKSFPDKLKN